MSSELEYSKVRDATYTDESYKLPNDSPEHERLERQASGLVSMMHGQTIHSPIGNPSKMVDIGCGTGIVTAYLADKYPKAEVFGVDLSLVPTIHAAPNLSWIQGNIRDLAGSHDQLKPNTFDLVHSRMLIWGMHDWPGYVKTQAKLAKPGGWVEIHDMSLQLFDYDKVMDVDSNECLQELFKAARSTDMDPMCGSNAKKYMQDAGLTNIHVKEFKWPFGTWMTKTNPETKEIGILWEECMEAVAYMVTEKLIATRVSGDKLDRLLDESRALWATVPGRSTGYIVTYGQKPI